MATLTEFEQTAAEGCTTFPAEEDPGWEQSCMTPDMDHVSALLDISEENSLKEQEPYEYHCSSGWEEAVQGWGRVSPLACLFLPQRKGKKPKNGEPEKMVEEGKHRESPELSSPLQPHHLTTSKYPVLKNKPTKHHKQTHRLTNIMLSWNSFTVLPPVELPQLHPQKVSGQLCNGESTAKGETSEVDGVMSATGDRGVEGGEETGEDIVANPELPKDTYSATLTSKYCTSQPSQHLLSVFSIPIPKRYEVPLTSRADTVHRPSYSLSRNLLQALHRPATPQLPILLGTKVRMPSSGQRLL